MPWLRRALRPLAVLFVLWSAGLLYFVASALLVRGDETAKTDAIVVLTGGRQRLRAGLDLLVAGKASKMFISGVDQRVDREELLRVLGPAAERAACCIVLGHDAEDTVGNARETANWAGEAGYRSLRLVTSWYHMPRSLMEFRRAMPELTIVANPVFAYHASPEHWSAWQAAHGAQMLLLEYHKFIGAWLRPLALTASPDRPIKSARIVPR